MENKESLNLLALLERSKNGLLHDNNAMPPNFIALSGKYSYWSTVDTPPDKAVSQWATETTGHVLTIFTD